MSVLAVTPIKHNGELYPIGTDVTKLPDIKEADIQSMVDAGGAVEIGKDRKYSNAPQAVIASGMEQSALRDEILRKANGGEDIPPSATAEGLPSGNSGSPADGGNDTPKADDAAAKKAQRDAEAAAKRAAEEAAKAAGN